MNKTAGWFLFTAAGIIALLTLAFGPILWKDVWGFLSSRQWWAENIPSFLVFTALFGVISWIVNVLLEKKYRAQFENWKVRIIWQGEETAQDLFWEEVEKFQKSDFERWKFVKSIVSGIGKAGLTTVHDAEKKETEWVSIRPNDKTIAVDLDAACAYGHVEPKDGGRVDVIQPAKPL